MVEDDIFVINVRGVFGKPMAEPIERRSLGNTCGTVEERSSMIRNEKVTGFTIETCVSGLTLAVL